MPTSTCIFRAGQGKGKQKQKETQTENHISIAWAAALLPSASRSPHPFHAMHRSLISLSSSSSSTTSYSRDTLLLLQYCGTDYNLTGYLRQSYPDWQRHTSARHSTAVELQFCFVHPPLHSRPARQLARPSRAPGLRPSHASTRFLRPLIRI